MTNVVPVKGVSGKIYRFVMVHTAKELPELPGIYTFALPLRYPGAPLESLYLGRARHDLTIEVLKNELRTLAIQEGANLIGYMEVASRLAQRRIYTDLAPVLPDRLPSEKFVQEPPSQVRASRIAR